MGKKFGPSDLHIHNELLTCWLCSLIHISANITGTFMLGWKTIFSNCDWACENTYGTAQVQGNVRTRLKRVLTASETRLPRV